MLEFGLVLGLVLVLGLGLGLGLASGDDSRVRPRLLGYLRVR